MAKIIHTSTGASNSPRNLEVNGLNMVIPKADLLDFDYQNDWGLTRDSETGQTIWLDKVTGTRMLTKTSPLVTLSSYPLIGGNPTVKIDNSTLNIGEDGRMWNNDWLNDSALRSFTFTTLVRMFNVEQEASQHNWVFTPIVNYSTWATVPAISLLCPIFNNVLPRTLSLKVYHTGYSQWENTVVDVKNIVSGSTWVRLVACVDFVNGVIRTVVDGGEVNTHAMNSTKMYTFGYQRADTGFGFSNRLSSANIAYCVGWLAGTEFTDQELVSIDTYMKTKYGLA